MLNSTLVIKKYQKLGNWGTEVIQSHNSIPRKGWPSFYGLLFSQQLRVMDQT